MSARKSRPEFGAAVADGMSLRDVAHCLGVSKSELHRWVQLAALPQDEFESRLAAALDDLGSGRLNTVTATTLLTETAAPVPAQGRVRVRRALAMFTAMSEAEQVLFLTAVGAKR